MDKSTPPEVWLRGSVAGVPGLLQPAVHALMQAREEVVAMMHDFPDELLWVKPSGMASPGYHLQHIAGFTDRLLTYKNDRQLSSAQLIYLEREGKPTEGMDKTSLLTNFKTAIENAIADIAATDIKTLEQQRFVGRNKLPSTVIGLVFHTAEHTMRHTGQLLVTVKILKNWI